VRTQHDYWQHKGHVANELHVYPSIKLQLTSGIKDADCNPLAVPSRFGEGPGVALFALCPHFGFDERFMCVVPMRYKLKSKVLVLAIHMV
jgi:hypothetical protein